MGWLPSAALLFMLLPFLHVRKMQRRCHAKGGGPWGARLSVGTWFESLEGPFHEPFDPFEEAEVGLRALAPARVDGICFAYEPGKGSQETQARPAKHIPPARTRLLNKGGGVPCLPEGKKCATARRDSDSAALLTRTQSRSTHPIARAGTPARDRARSESPSSALRRNSCRVFRVIRATRRGPAPRVAIESSERVVEWIVDSSALRSRAAGTPRARLAVENWKGVPMSVRRL